VMERFIIVRTDDGFFVAERQPDGSYHKVTVAGFSYSVAEQDKARFDYLGEVR